MKPNICRVSMRLTSILSYARKNSLCRISKRLREKRISGTNSNVKKRKRFALRLRPMLILNYAPSRTNSVSRKKRRCR